MTVASAMRWYRTKNGQGFVLCAPWFIVPTVVAATRAKHLWNFDGRVAFAVALTGIYVFAVTYSKVFIFRGESGESRVLVALRLALRHAALSGAFVTALEFLTRFS